jgi:ADP-ribose pyrophosphatase
MKIPENAKRVYKGQIFEVYEWEQEMFDGSKDTFEMIKRPDTIQIIPIKDGKIVLSEQEQPSKPPFSAFLGGRAEEDEDPETAAKRELLEESGLASDDWELVRSYEPYTKFDWTIYLYVARNCKKVAEQNLDPGERIKLVEVSFEEFLETIEKDEFWGHEIANDIYRMKHTPGKLEEFKKKLFP